MAAKDPSDQAAADHTQPHVNTPPPTTGRASLGLAITAAVLITAITGIAFWLSYAHLHDVDTRHGLATDPARAWAWPAVLDLFYLAGELLILRAAWHRTIDWWAIALTVLGAAGSIGLNVAGVGPSASPLDYIVAAVPPVASLLAFGALMNQVWRLLARHAVAPTALVSAAVDRVEVQRVANAQPAPASAPPAIPPLPATAPALPPAPIVYSDPACAPVRALYNHGTRPGTKAMREAISAAGIVPPSDSTIRSKIRAEVETHERYLASLPAAI